MEFFFSFFQCGPQVFSLSIMLPPSPFEIENPGLNYTFWKLQVQILALPTFQKTTKTFVLFNDFPSFLMTFSLLLIILVLNKKICPENKTLCVAPWFMTWHGWCAVIHCKSKCYNATTTTTAAATTIRGERGKMKF